MTCDNKWNLIFGNLKTDQVMPMKKNDSKFIAASNNTC